MKRLVGSNASCRSTELEAENSRFQMSIVILVVHKLRQPFVGTEAAAKKSDQIPTTGLGVLSIDPK